MDSQENEIKKENEIKIGHIKRNLWLTLFGKGISQIGSKLFGFAMSFYILSVTGSSQSFAMTLILTVLPSVILSPFVGNLADRVNKKWMVVGADFLSGIFMMIMFAIIQLQGISLWIVYLSTFVLSLLFTILSTAYSSAYPSIVDDAHLTQINSLSQGIESFISIFSPILGGALYALVSPEMFFIVNGISFIGSAVSECFIDFDLNSKLKNQERQQVAFFEQMKDGFRYAKRYKLFMTVAIYALLINIFLSAVSLVLPYNLITIHHLSSTSMGFIEGAFPIGALIMSLVLGVINLSFSKRIFGTSMLLFAALILMMVIPVLPMFNFVLSVDWYYAVIMVLLGVVVILVNVPLNVLLQKSIEESYRGRMLGMLGALSQAAIPLAYLAYGVLLNHVESYMILISLSIILILFAVSIYSNKTLDTVDHSKAVQDV